MTRFSHSLDRAAIAEEKIVGSDTAGA
jgi:hypothetical protein